MTSGAAARQRRAADIGLLLVLVVGAAFLASYILRGWYPHDEGALGQSAERILGGEIPHRDFDEIYTGLLGFLHAGVFALLGIKSAFLRIPLFIATMGWLVVVYRLLLRFVPPVGAAAVAMVVLVWSVPNYPASLPSWYILFAATGTALALVRWQETGRRGFLVLAGALGGVAFLFKLSGIFVWLGGGLALLAVGDVAGDAADRTNHGAPGSAAGSAEASRTSRGAFEWIVAAALVLVVLALGVVAGRAGSQQLLRFVFPTGVLAIAISGAIAAPPFAPAADRWRTLAARVGPFALGVIVPVGLFLVFYALVGGLPEMLEGVFVTPFRRVAFASVTPPPVVTLLLVVPLAALLWLPSAAGRARVIVPALGALWFGAILLFAGSDPRFYRAGWFSAWGLLFVAAIEGARMVLARRHDPREGSALREDGAGGEDPSGAGRRVGGVRDAAIVVACLAVAIALVEYPFAAPIYTVYALPLTMLAVVGGVRSSRRVGVATQWLVLVFFLAFGITRIVPGSVGSMGIAFHRTPDVALLELPRGGLRIDPREAVQYEDLIRFVVERAEGRPIWAGPDSPEVYFLSGIPNRTRTFFDFLDAPETMATPLADRLDALGVGVVVVKLNSQFSRGLSRETYMALRERFPRESGFPGFVVLWR